MRIQHNISAMNTQRQLGANNTSTSKSLEKLSSGYRVNRAGDDAAGLAISEKMRAQIRGLNRASENAQDGVSLIQAAEGALQETHSILQRMRELSVQAANDVNETEDRQAIQDEINQLVKEVDRIATTTEFNKKTLLDGSLNGGGLYTKLGTGIGIQSASTTNATEAGVYTIDTTSVAVKDTATLTVDVTAGGDSMGSADYVTVSFADMGTGATPLIITGDELVGKTDTEINSYIANKIVSHMNNKDSGITEYKAELSGMSGVQFTAVDAGLMAASGSISLTFTTNSTADAPPTLTFATATETATGGADAVYTITGIRPNGTDIAPTTDASTDYDAKSGYLTVYDGSNDVILNLKINDATKPVTQTITVDTGRDLTLQVGANTGEPQTIAIGVANLSAVGLGLSALDVSTHKSSQTAVASIESALQKVSDQRAALGAVQNRLEHVSANLDTVSENLQSAEARIRDTDMAKEMMEFTKNNILMQAAQSMLAQANALPQGVLQLLR